MNAPIRRAIGVSGCGEFVIVNARNCRYSFQALTYSTKTLTDHAQSPC
jgi:hypothetical protein